MLTLLSVLSNDNYLSMIRVIIYGASQCLNESSIRLYYTNKETNQGSLASAKACRSCKEEVGAIIQHCADRPRRPDDPTTHSSRPSTSCRRWWHHRPKERRRRRRRRTDDDDDDAFGRMTPGVGGMPQCGITWGRSLELVLFECVGCWLRQ